MQLRKLVLFLSIFGLVPFVWAEEDKKEAAKKDDDDDDDDLDDLDNDEPAKEDKPAEAASEVAVLTDDNFDDFIKKNPTTIVKFYAPWCGHCKAMAPAFDAASLKLKAKKRQTKLAKVDATIHSKVAQAHNVQGYPHLIFYKNGELQTYDGPRDEEGIIKYVEKQEKNPVEECPEFEDLKTRPEWTDNDHIVIARVVKKSGKYNAVKKAAMAMNGKDQLEGIYICAEYIPKKEEKNASLTIMRPTTYLKSEPTKSEFATKKWNGSNVAKWIVKESYNTVTTYDDKKHSPDMVKEVGAKYPLVVSFGEDYTLEERNEVLESLDKLGKDKDFKLAVVESHVKRDFEINDEQTQPALKKADSTMGDKIKQLLGYSGKTTVTILKDQDKYVKAGIKGKDLSGFVKDFKAGNLKPWYKTQDAPTGDKEYVDGVKVLVGSTFEDFALSSDKDVLVKFYAPWCGHCKALEPTWKKLAEAIKEKGKGKKVVVAKMDSTENGAREEVTGFPKIVLYPAVKNSFMRKKELNGARELDNILDFLAENAVHGEGLDAQTKPGESLKGQSMVERELARKKAAEGKKGKKEGKKGKKSKKEEL